MREGALTRLRRDRVDFVFQSYNLLSELVPVLLEAVPASGLSGLAGQELAGRDVESATTNRGDDPRDNCQNVVAASTHVQHDRINGVVRPDVELDVPRRADQAPPLRIGEVEVPEVVP
ncbi:hypothetical protein ACLQ28_14140 [Micromonospora sp. DT201]|uniref:hypothetical protein n=1 Tax=Micromonospora sp. DT201 TaxID=3393442 RepID=UPI003CEDE69C